MEVTEEIRGWPEFQACLPFFEGATALCGQSSASTTIEDECLSVIHYLLIERQGRREMHRSKIYGTREAAEKLAKLMSRLGHAAKAEQVYGRDDRDWAVVIHGR